MVGGIICRNGGRCGDIFEGVTVEVWEGFLVPFVGVPLDTAGGSSRCADTFDILGDFDGGVGEAS